MGTECNSALTITAYQRGWVRFVGRWGTRIAGPVGLALTVYDFGTEVAPPMAEGLGGYQASTQNESILFRICFEKGTLVNVGNSFIPIETIKKGQEILSFNFKTNKTEYNKVKKIVENKVSEIYKLTTENQIINVTEEHPFYVVNKGWIKVKDLKSGDLLKTSNENYEELKSIIKEEKQTFVYNIEVKGNHNYFVTKRSILVHNKKIKSKIIK